MTRKDYVMIAEAVRDVKDETASKGGIAVLKTVVDYIGDGMKRDNPRFDRERFVAACGF